MEIGRGTSDIEQHARSESLNSGAIEHDPLETTVHYFRRGANRLRQALSQIAYALLVNQIDEVGTA